MQWWNDYWFRPQPYADLAMVRIITVLTQLAILLPIGPFTPKGVLVNLERMALLPDGVYSPIIALKLFMLPFGLDARPSFEVMTAVYYGTLFVGVLALIGLATRLSMMAFALGNIFMVAFIYSFYDFHHTEAPLFIALLLLALSPVGHALSVDAALRRRNGQPVEAEGPMAGWAIRAIQWLFVLIYLSAVLSKLVFNGGLDWLNGYTLQYVLIQDSLRKGTLLGLWFSQYHLLILISQYLVVIFQATFALAVLFPRLLWIYVPLGLGFHIGNIFLLNAPFPQWIALYAVFIPWRRLFQLVGRRWNLMTQPAPA